MESDSLASRMEHLEQEFDALRAATLASREKEYRKLVLKQVEEVFDEFSRKEVVERIECMDNIYDCSKRKFCKNLLKSKVEAAGLAFMNGDYERSIALLDEIEDKARGVGSECESGNCRIYALALISEVRTVLTLAIRIEEKAMEMPPITSLGQAPPLDSVTVSEALAPLAHPARIDILADLEKGERGFSELSKELDLRTGHLQFHLKTLEKGGYVKRDRKGGKYRISLQGVTALEGLRSFMSNLVKV